jgi:hypothetical protein
MVSTSLVEIASFELFAELVPGNGRCHLPKYSSDSLKLANVYCFVKRS